MLTCFISYTWREGEYYFARQLADTLKERDIKIWIDEERIFPSYSIEETIRKGIEHESDVFLFVISPETLKSKMCRYELRKALNQREEYGKPIIPVLFKECKIPGFLRNICYGDFRNPLYFDAAIERLIKGINRSYEIAQLYRELSHPDPEERIRAIQKLDKLKISLALGPLKNRLLFEELDPNVKYWLAISIGEIGGSKAIDILAQTMQEEDPYAQLGIIEGMIDAFKSLDKKGFIQALNVLSRAINSDNSIKRLCAVKILISLRQKNDQIESILYKLTNDLDNNIRNIAKEYFQKGKGVL